MLPPWTRFRRCSAAAVTVALTLAGVTVVGMPAASAAVFEVTVAADGGAGSLRDAFAQASAAGEASEIVLAPGAYYLLTDCGEGDLDYTGTDPLTITGNGAAIEQTCDERVIESDGDLVVTDTLIRGGREAGGFGGGIAADTNRVTLVRSTVAENEASTGGGVGAIRVTLVDSTVMSNVATSTGGGVWADQTIEATNSTITANIAGSGGGGIAVVNTSATLLYATVAGNVAPVGANIQLQAGSDALVSFGTVVAKPVGGGADCAIDAGATTTSQGSNFSSDGSCGFGAGARDVAGGGDAGLAAAADNGGPTLTMLPVPGSPLIDGADCAAAPAAVTTDQRGVARPQGGACDIGAVEVEPAVPVDPRFTG